MFGALWDAIKSREFEQVKDVLQNMFYFIPEALYQSPEEIKPAKERFPNPNSPLHVAVQDNDLETVRRLLQNVSKLEMVRDLQADLLEIVFNINHSNTHCADTKIAIIDLLCMHGANLAKNETILAEQLAIVETIPENPQTASDIFKCKIATRFFFERLYGRFIKHLFKDDRDRSKKYLLNIDDDCEEESDEEVYDGTIKLDVVVKNKQHGHPYYGRPILQACSRKNLSTLIFLHEECGIPIDGRDAYGNTVLHTAASCDPDVRHDYVALLDYLLNKTDAIKLLNIQNNRGYTALHMASSNDFFQGVEALLQAGADPAILDKQGNSAKSGAHKAILFLLEQYEPQSRVPSLQWLCQKKMGAHFALKRLPVPEHLKEGIHLAWYMQRLNPESILKLCRQATKRALSESKERSPKRQCLRK